jgi:hypothetical protein
VIGAVVTRNDGFERRAREMPWGIEVQVWRLVETITIPASAATLPLNSLFPDPEVGAIPAPRTDDDRTLENVVDGPTAEDSVELVCRDDGEASTAETPAPEAQEGKGTHGR